MKNRSTFWLAFASSLVIFAGSALAQTPRALSTLDACDDADDADLLYLVKGGVSKKCAVSNVRFGTPEELAPYGQYDPDNPPASCTYCDEFTNDSYTLSWFVANAGSTTITLENDTMILDGSGNTDGVHGNAFAAPAGVDWTLHGKVSLNFQVGSTSAFDGCGIGALYAGTLATPTGLVTVDYIDASTDRLLFGLWSSYTATTSIFWQNNRTIDDYFTLTYWWRLRYTTSTKVMSAEYSRNGIDYYDNNAASTALSADPTYAFAYGRDQGLCRVHYMRLRTGAGRDFPGE